MDVDRQVDDQVSGTGDGVLPRHSDLAGVGRDVHEPFEARLARIDVEAANQVGVFHQPHAEAGAAWVRGGPSQDAVACLLGVYPYCWMPGVDGHPCDVSQVKTFVVELRHPCTKSNEILPLR